MNKEWIKLSVPVVVVVMMAAGCGRSEVTHDGLDNLRADIDSLAAMSKGTVGVALITPDGDTMTVNNEVRFPLMSVFKLHEAIAVAEATDLLDQSFDSVITVSRGEVSADTWSPMLKDYPEGDFEISIGELVKYMLLVSDNNASNLLFDRVVSVSRTDSLIHSFGLPGSLELRFTEREMQADHDKSYLNRSTPMACAALIRKIFTDMIVSAVKQDSIRSWLGQCTSANDRMAAGVAQYEGAKLYHRTGSGYINDRGEVIAVNDVGVIELPDGRQLAVAILVKDYAGSQEDADAEIAAITKIILKQYYNGKEKRQTNN